MAIGLWAWFAGRVGPNAQDRQVGFVCWPTSRWRVDTTEQQSGPFLLSVEKGIASMPVEPCLYESVAEGPIPRSCSEQIYW